MVAQVVAGLPLVLRVVVVEEVEVAYGEREHDCVAGATEDAVGRGAPSALGARMDRLSQ